MLPDLLKLDGLLKEIYVDLAKPGVSQVGKAIGAIIGLGNTALWPIHLLNERSRIALETKLEAYRAELESTPIEAIVPIPPEIGVPLLEKFTTVFDPALSQMYARLLLQASTQHGQARAHPKFIHVLDSISPDEALVLHKLSVKSSIQWSLETLRTGTDGPTHNRLRISGLNDLLHFPLNIQLYFINLHSLGLITEPQSDLLTQDFDFSIPKSEGWPRTQVIVRGGTISLTKMGKLFIEACGAAASTAGTV